MTQLDNHHGDRRKKRKKRYPGCLAHAVIVTFYGFFANQRQPQYTYTGVIFYSVGANRGQLLFLYISRGGFCSVWGCYSRGVLSSVLYGIMTLLLLSAGTEGCECPQLLWCCNCFECPTLVLRVSKAPPTAKISIRVLL